MRNTCLDCKKDLPESEFHFHRGRPRPACIACWKIRCSDEYKRNKAHRIKRAIERKRENPERTSEHGRTRRMKLKMAAFVAYSINGIPECACCKNKILIHLTIDHINENGAEHRREINKGRKSSNHGYSGGCRTYIWLKQNGYPSGFQVLCFNCNFAKHNLGSCPCQNISDRSVKIMA